ncbi:sulfate permease [Aestuariicella sp. G3-2]|uniref:SulP family inorganic anion transporter n=1 Tax=Pseudomaricurvus albidus TaxID=2842452 RepID=UPI001C0AA2C6|nr:sulfate permease [Aestuariicella albida]MBU3069327.1 sulfate permease [Aestuariicella albida]
MKLMQQHKLPWSFPLGRWLKDYRKETLVRDCVAGIVVSIVMVPQSMGYALLAGMPAEYGLYCAILPAFLYAFLGSSRSLSVGPAALISIMLAGSVATLNPQTEVEYIHYVVNISLLVGVFLMAMSLLRLGRLTNYISVPVISGFTSAAALTIMVSQLKHMMGVELGTGLDFGHTLLSLVQSIGQINIVTVVIGVSACVALWFFKTPFPRLIQRLKLPSWLEQALSKSGPMVVVLASAVMVAVLHLETSAQVSVVGNIPQGLPALSGISVDIALWKQLAMPSFLIALMCFITSIAVSSSLASKRRERVDSNQELLALGVANLGAAFSGTFALAGSLSRSAVNDATGAETTISSMVCALCIVVTLLFLTAAFYYLPLAVLGAIVIMSVFSMIDVQQFLRCWRLNRADAYSLLATFLAVLIFDIQTGIGVGIVLSVVLLLHRASHPHIAVVGRVGDSAHFRNIERHDVITSQSVVAIRVDESIYFSNVQYIEDFILEQCASHPQANHIVLICSSVSFVDTTAVDELERLIDKLRENEITLHFAEVKGPVMDQLKKTRLLDRLQPGRVFFTTDEAMRTLTAVRDTEQAED